MNIFLQGCNSLYLKASEHDVDIDKNIRKEKIKTSYQEVSKTLWYGGQNGLPIDLGSVSAPDLLNRAWSLIGAWVEGYLDGHPAASADDIISSLRELDITPPNPNSLDEGYELDGNAIKIAPDTYAIAAYYPLVGTFFIVSRKNQDHFHVVWDIKKLAKAHYDGQDELGRWAHLTAVVYGNGPLIGSVNLLPESITRNPRFYVDATTTGQGGTIPGQLSIWEWNGVEARSLLVGLFTYYVDGRPIEFDGQYLKIHTKGQLKTFYSCGMCPDPEVLWTIRVTPEGVEDLGRKDVVPELRMFDELWYRLTNDLPADDFASQQVILEIKHLIDYMKTENPSPEGYKSLSMLGGWKVMKENNIETFFFTADNLDCNQLLFEVEQKQGSQYFSHLSIVDKCKANADIKCERNN